MFHSATISILEQAVTEDNFTDCLLPTWSSNLCSIRVSIRAIFFIENYCTLGTSLVPGRLKARDQTGGTVRTPMPAIVFFRVALCGGA